MKSTFIIIRVSPEEKERLKEIARKRKMSLSECLRYFLPQDINYPPSEKKIQTSKLTPH